MDYWQLRGELGKGNFKPLYLLFGDEGFLIDEAINYIRKKKSGDEDNYHLLDEPSSAQDIINTVGARTFWGSGKTVVVKNISALDKTKKAAMEVDELIKFLGNHSGDDCLIFVSYQLDKRKKLGKFFSKNKLAYEFPEMKGQSLKKWVTERCLKKKVKLSPAALERLIELAGKDLRRLDSELEKLFLRVIQEDSREVTKTDVEAMVSGDLEANIFDFVDYLGNRKKKEALGLLAKMLAAGEPPLKILFMMARQLRLLLQASYLSKLGSNALAKELKVAPFVVKKLEKQAEKYSSARLEKSIIYLHEIDYKIKTGQIPPNLALELVVAEI